MGDSLPHLILRELRALMKRFLLHLGLFVGFLAGTPRPNLAQNAPQISAGVVIITAIFNDGTSEIGSGFLVDHDGLIVTADHVLRGATSVPNDPSQIPQSNRQIKHLTVYLLDGTRSVEIDVRAGDITWGSGQHGFLDVALFRVPIDDQLRSALQPLEISTDVPKKGQALFAFGPACSPVKPSNANCQVAGPQAAILGNEPKRARTYEVSTLLSLGFSGGPLVDSLGRVVGICSSGDTLALSQAVARASYTPVTYLTTSLADNIPQSQFFSGAAACRNAHSLSSLTFFDFQELSAPWRSSAGVLSDASTCVCCCESLSHASNAMLATGLSTKCSPPFCLTERFEATRKAVSVFLNQLGPDIKKLALSYRALYDLTKEINSEHSLGVLTRWESDITFAEIAADISRRPELVGLPYFSSAQTDAADTYLALLKEFKKSTNKYETHEIAKSKSQFYDDVAAFLSDIPSSNDKRGFQAAIVLGTLTKTSDETNKSFDETLKQLAIDPGKLTGYVAQDLGIARSGAKPPKL